jgi:hypothetical protein
MFPNGSGEWKNISSLVASGKIDARITMRWTQNCTKDIK